ncbi:hypothetical protein BGHDH14_bgh02631 [Blumeria hordei DH14]|uniref:Uncharacterized protein n=1 Tax=Blumeria graminis f. sp. hordei (strain DH14) TaxID=546991 RepID=N1J771_BLUG1|nr:hypothetical protein BGHDH14_bgh02631 [Blumeria hordei DH14]
MSPFSDASNNDSSKSQVDYSSSRPQNIRISIESQPAVSSGKILPHRASNTSLNSLLLTTSTSTISRSNSPSRVGKLPRLVSSQIFENNNEKSQNLSLIEQPEDPRSLILQAFVPHIAVHSSIDTTELVNDKGFQGGLCRLLRPFGEQVQGKVTVRDSIGAGKTWEDYSVRFSEFGNSLGTTGNSDLPKVTGGYQLVVNGNKERVDNVLSQREPTNEIITSIEALVEYHLAQAENFSKEDRCEDHSPLNNGKQSPDEPTPFYALFMRGLISNIPLTPHETFSHPVACVIAISSRNANPIETLRELYDDANYGKNRLPTWVNNDYLRYYVLVHDEERSDFTKSVALFDQMKRHFGLHCHLLRLRSSRCIASDDDSMQLPRCKWMSASEQISEIQAREAKDEDNDHPPYIYGSDTIAIKTFIREMVNQSIIPSMERCVATWNDQVASRRRGLSGRILSISKQWAGFGRNSRNSTVSSGSTGSNPNYDSEHGFYRFDAPEALMRKLADYAFMLRDWKLALSTYDLLRSDFSTDKAWKYHAAANEMAAISALLVPKPTSSKTRAEAIDQMLETASYSYTTRCGVSYGTLRCLIMGMELLRLRGGSATSDAAKWGLRLLEYKVVGAVGDALLKERIAACYASNKGIETRRWGSRTRKSALWSIQAADSWLAHGKPQQSKRQLDNAKIKYSQLLNKDSLKTFTAASTYLESLQREVQLALMPVPSKEESILIEDLETLVEDSEGFDSRPNRRSIMSGIAPSLSGLATTPLKANFLESEGDPLKLDQFE